MQRERKDELVNPGVQQWWYHRDHDMLKVQIKTTQHNRLQGFILHNMQIVEMQEQVSQQVAKVRAITGANLLQIL